VDCGRKEGVYEGRFWCLISTKGVIGGGGLAEFHRRWWGGSWNSPVTGERQGRLDQSEEITQVWVKA
jgi:hypothetical protein